MKLEINNVTKTYKGGVQALSDFSLTVETGILGLLGPNGAGKSTLMRILSTITKPTKGTVKWNGADIADRPNAIRPILGYLPQAFGVYPHLNAVEFLSYLAAARGIRGGSARKRIDQLLELVNLADMRKRPLGTLSGGMKQRVGIAQALLNDPLLLIVDEPTAGLDPGERVGFRHLLTELSGERIILLSSHIVSDIEATATDIAIVNKGKLLRHDTPEKLLGELEGGVWEMKISSTELPAMKEEFIISGTVRTSEGIRVKVVSPTAPAASAVNVPPTLEEAYLHLLAEAKKTGDMEKEG